jgi:hypothetical protein
MINLLWFVGVLAVQADQPTVGDTVWLTRKVSVPAGFTVRASDWEPPEPVELLGRARVSISGSSAEISYPVVLWEPGRHLVDVPGALLLGPGGTVDSLGSERVRVDVRSVLPPVPTDSAVAPQPRAAIVAQNVTTLAPVAIAWAAALFLLLPLHIWWWKRGKPTPARAANIPAEALEPPLTRWADAGEYRAVANVSSLRLRAAVAERVAAAHPGLDTERVLAELAATRPEWPLEELSELLRALDDARFGVTPAPDALELSHSSVAMRDRLLRTAA